QAEDGIRDLIVTGVQTCALPICLGFPINPSIQHSINPFPAARGAQREPAALYPASHLLGRSTTRPETRQTETLARWFVRSRCSRSEERRVGKECRCRGWRGQSEE